MTALLEEIRALIATDGPISVERYMALALGHPRHGYYRTRDPLGAAGDFTTAPEISQMFGELLGLWAVTVWQAMGSPAPVCLVELGPGRGTLMADALRAARALPAFRTALDLHMVETSPVLRQAQQQALASVEATATWHDDIGTLPPGPALMLANEFFDALPIRQFVRTDTGVHERLVGLGADGRLAFGLSPDPLTRQSRWPVPAPGATGVFEVSLAGEAIVRSLATRLVAQGGALLAIDYGSVTSGPGDTLQAVRRHGFVDPLAEPGEADITAHVDFAALGRAAADCGARVHGPVTQGALLLGLGLAERTAALSRARDPAQAATLSAAAERLAGPEPGMGHLFKAIAVTGPDLTAVPGFTPEDMP
ncbi:SAM-dependent methyltransferase [Lichenihabitans sp. Uapishka_5]|uniref:class I SAM-dependent methyltransferase n=1 Tax=Lichenihabitans sp. Uapishka_5 TaxID=3037302 RepID=UPI0029E807C2|nr:SAM-dependent methyltransferase [Lichenihabitans sp. Uapishka_5]MDX7951153.1 SAM-dependent methyltransferase [Lichenihabitans sp. Uapishka_5]